MPRKSAKGEKVIQRLDEDLHGDLKQYPSFVERFFTDNYLQRSLSYLLAFDEEGKARKLQVSRDGLLKVLQQASTYLQSPLAVDFGREWHKYICNWEELKAEIVNYVNEGIPRHWSQDNDYALKFTVNPGETKYMRIPITLGNHGVVVRLILYLTGDVTAEFLGAWMYSNPVAKSQNEWLVLTGRSTEQGVWIKFSASNGGAVYIKYIAIYHLTLKLSELREIISNPNLTLDGTTTYTYYMSTPINKSQAFRVTVFIAGDGTNALTVDIYLKTVDGLKLVGTVSRIGSTLATYDFFIPCSLLNYNSYPLTYFQLDISGYGTFKRYDLTRYNLEELNLRYAGNISQSASEISTTPVLYTLIDNDGYGKIYKNLKADITIATGGGSVEILINGKSVGTYTASQTVDLSWFSEPIFKIEANIAGDGTSASSVTVSGQEFDYAYLVSR